MSVKLEKKTTVNPIGKPMQCTVGFKGYYRGIPAVLTLKAETERDTDFQVPLVPDKSLDIEIIDPQTVLSNYFVDEKALEKISKAAQKMIDEDKDKDQENQE